MAVVTTRLLKITAFHCVSPCQKKCFFAVKKHQALIINNKNHAKKQKRKEKPVMNLLPAGIKIITYRYVALYNLL